MEEETDVIYDDNAEHNGDGENEEDVETMDAEDDPEAIAARGQAENCTKMTLSAHNSAVFTAAISPLSEYVVTGAEDDCAFVYSCCDGAVLHKIEEFDDSVTQMCFVDSQQHGLVLAVADMRGHLQVFTCANGTFTRLYDISSETSGEDVELEFMHSCTVDLNGYVDNCLILGCANAPLTAVSINTGDVAEVESPRDDRPTCAVVLPDKCRLCVGYESGKRILIDMRSPYQRWLESKVPIGADECTAIAVNAAGDRILSGDCIGEVVVQRVDTLEALATLPRPPGAENSGAIGTIEALAYNQSASLFAAVANDGRLAVYDGKRNVYRGVTQLGTRSLTALQWLDERRLLVSSYNGCIYMCDALTVTPLRTLLGNDSSVLGMALVPKRTATECYVLVYGDNPKCHVLEIKL